MNKKICAMLLLSLAISGCDSNSTGTNSNANNANANVAASPTVSPSAAQASPTASPSATVQPAPPAPLKTGDRVKIMVNGSATEATVVSVDEKLGKVTVRVQGESKDRTVAIADIRQ